MIAGLDSSADRPTAAIADAARSAGIGLWSGYLATKPNVNLFSVWSQADFDNARRCGGTPLAFCSGLDDPVACRNLAAQWNVRLCLDVESGIRADGSWVQPWLDASDAGLYGLASVHSGRTAAFHVLALYPGFDPGATWSNNIPRPSGPVGWQWQGSHIEFGLSVDRGWYDDWFGGAAPAIPKSLGGSADMTLAVTARPDQSGVDVFRVAPDGNVYWQGNTPYWQLGAWGQISAEGDTRAVSALWVDSDSLVVMRLDRQGRVFQNALHPSTGWRFGAWVENGAPWMVPAAVGDLRPGPPGPPGPNIDSVLRTYLKAGPAG